MSVMNGGIFQIHKVQTTTGTQVDPPLASPNPYPDYSVETLPVAGAPPTKGYYQIAFNVTYYCASCTATSRDSCTYAGGAPNVVSPDAATAVVSPAFAKNQTRASQLIIRRNSVILPLQAARQALDPTDGRFYGDVYYCYDDRPQNDSSVPPSPTVMITELNDIKNYDSAEPVHRGPADGRHFGFLHRAGATGQWNRIPVFDYIYSLPECDR